jgi:hypothetical protein
MVVFNDNDSSRFDPPRELTDEEDTFVEDVRESFKAYETYIKSLLIPSRERSVVLKTMEETIMWLERAVLQTGLNNGQV